MMAFEIVDVGEEIAFNVEHCLQLWSTIEPLLRQCRLADQSNGLRQIAINMRIIGRRAVMPHDIAELFETCLGRGIEDEVNGTRMRIKQYQGSGSRVHG